MKKFTKVFWGLILIAVGALYALNAFGIVDFTLFFDGWWTLFIIIPCFGSIFNGGDKTGGIIGTLVGIALLLAAQGVYDYDMVWKLLLPIFLVAIGVSIVVKTFRGRREHETVVITSADGNDHTIVFSGLKLNYNGKTYSGGNLVAVFGGIDLDLRGAIFESDVVINATSVFGGIDIILPDDVKVIVDSTSIFGGTDNKRARRENIGERTVYINTYNIFGGSDIK